MKLNHYETTVIIHPSATKAQVGSLTQQYKKLLKQENAKVIHEENEGLQNLAYPIQKQTSGIYYIIRYQAPGTAVDKLERAYKIDENIMRFLSIKLDKHGVAYHKKKREEAKKQALQENNTEKSTEESQ